MGASTRRALLVATGTYAEPRLRRLRGAAADADQLARVLSDADVGGFEVDIARDCDERDLRRRIARFFRSCARDDVLLLHISGHGVKDARGALFLAAADTELDLLDATAISANWLDDQMNQSPSRHKLLLLDCCFSGKFPFDSTARAGDGVDVQERLQGRGRAVITASNAMEYAYEGDQLSGQGEPSFFTAATIEALETGRADRDEDGWISVDELYDYVFEHVKERSGNQTPSKQIALEGPLYVARSTYRRPIEPAPLVPRLLELVEDRYSGARLGAVEELAELLDSTNPGVALAARQTLEGMLDDDSRKVAARARAVLGTGEVHGSGRHGAESTGAAEPRPARRESASTRVAPEPRPVPPVRDPGVSSAQKPPVEPAPARTESQPSSAPSPHQPPLRTRPEPPGSRRAGDRAGRWAEVAAVVLAVGLLISLSEPYFYACSSCGSTWSDFSTDVSVLLAGALIVAAALPFLRLAGVARDHWTGRAVALNAAALVALVVVVFAPGVRGDFRLMREYSVQVPDIWRWSTHPARWIGAACAMGLVAAGMVLAYRAWRPQRVPE